VTRLAGTRAGWVAGEGRLLCSAPPSPERTTLDDLNQLVTPSIGAIIFALGVVVLGLLVIVLVLARRLSKLDTRIATLTAGGDGASLESTLEAHIDKVYAVAREVDALEVRTAVLERLQPDAFQRLGLVRYNPFEDTGGNQSFALALLDQHGDGFIVSSLHTRTATRVYGKAITGGKADGALSDEEAEALRIALASGTGSAKA
jgi:hypothetical protein